MQLHPTGQLGSGLHRFPCLSVPHSLSSGKQPSPGYFGTRDMLWQR